MDRPPIYPDRRSTREAIFESALRLDPPWRITRIEFREGEGIIKAFIDFPRGRLFCCPLCGKPLKAYDTTEKEWRQLDSPRQGVLENKAS